MKMKFSDYEEQSEDYYKNMLDKFKDQARKAVTKKQQELDVLTDVKNDHETRIDRLQERIKERNIKNFWSDQEEESEDEPAVDFLTKSVDIEEYNYYRAERRRYKLKISQWVKAYREQNMGANPSEEASSEIAMELADYNHANTQYLEVKMAMIKQNKLPFNAIDYQTGAQTGMARQGTMRSTKNY